MPVEDVCLNYDLDGRTLRSEHRTIYEEHARLPSGNWYPARWQHTWRHYSDDKLESSDTSDIQLRIWPDVEISEDWFTDPAGTPRFEKAP